MEEKERILLEALEKINNVMWEGFMVKSKGFSNEDGNRIMDILNKAFEEHDKQD